MARPRGRRDNTAPGLRPEDGAPRRAPDKRRRGTDPAERLRGHLDTPLPGTPASGEVHVAGWAFHPQQSIRGIVVLVDGRMAGTAALTIERPDVAALFPGREDGLLSGWSTTIPVRPSTSEEARVEVFAILEPRGRLAGTEARLGRPVLLASLDLARVAGDQLGGGPDGMSSPSARFIWPEKLSVGYNRVIGLVDVPGEVSSVEVTSDGVPTGRARTAVPGHSFRADRQPSAQIAQFEAGAFLDDAGDVTLAGVVTCTDGSTVDITPTTFTVIRPPDLGPSAERMQAVRQRLHSRVPDVGVRSADRQHAPVLLLTHDLGLGGGQLWLHELVVRLARRGVPMVMTSPRGGVLVDEIEALGIPVLVTGALDAHSPEGYEAHVLLVAQWAREHGCRAAIANTMSSFAGVDAAQRMGLPVAWAIHESFPLDQFWVEAFPPPLPDYAADRGRVALGRTDIAVFEAQATLDLYAPHLPDGAGQVVPYGVDFTDIDRYQAATDRTLLREKLGFADSTLVLLCIGTIEPRKGQVNLAQAFLGADRLRDEDICLVFVGGRSGAPYTEALRDYVDAMDGGDRVRIEPVQPDTYQWYHAADVLLCASDVESLPRSMLEVMAFSTSVASTAVFGIPELITDGEHGFLCEQRDLAALRAMLERVAATPRADLATMGQRARELVTVRHDPAVYERHFLEWIDASTTEPVS